jgi:hypothetical protein
VPAGGNLEFNGQRRWIAVEPGVGLDPNRAQGGILQRPGLAVAQASEAGDMERRQLGLVVEHLLCKVGWTCGTGPSFHPTLPAEGWVSLRSTHPTSLQP